MLQLHFDTLRKSNGCGWVPGEAGAAGIAKQPIRGSQRHVCFLGASEGTEGPFSHAGPRRCRAHHALGAAEGEPSQEVDLAVPRQEKKSETLFNFP